MQNNVIFPYEFKPAFFIRMCKPFNVEFFSSFFFSYSIDHDQRNDDQRTRRKFGVSKRVESKKLIPRLSDLPELSTTLPNGIPYLHTWLEEKEGVTFGYDVHKHNL